MIKPGLNTKLKSLVAAPGISRMCDDLDPKPLRSVIPADLATTQSAAGSQPSMCTEEVICLCMLRRLMPFTFVLAEGQSHVGVVSA